LENGKIATSTTGFTINAKQLAVNGMLRGVILEYEGVLISP